MPDDSMDFIQQQVAQACMQTRDVISPILESAEGMKADMVSRGWTPVNAEAVATAYVQSMLQKALAAIL